MAAETLSPAGSAGIVLVILLAAAILAYVLIRRSRPAGARRPQVAPGSARAPQAAPEPVSGSSGQQAAAWAPPRQEPPAAPAAGASLAVEIMLLRPEANGLEVSWTAVVNGSEPVAVHWGPPAIELEGEMLDLRYACEPGPDFAPPRTRCYDPREMISRVATVPWPVLGRSPAGLSVRVTVGYGPAGGLEAALDNQAAYAAWQRVARSRARPVPGS